MVFGLVFSNTVPSVVNPRKSEFMNSARDFAGQKGVRYRA